MLKLFRPPAAIKPIMEKPAISDAADEDIGKSPFSMAIHDKNWAAIEMNVPSEDERVVVNAIDFPHRLSFPP